MRNWLFIIGLFCITSCTAPRMMTRDRFSNVVVGETSFNDLKKCCGQPYSVRQKKSGEKEYQWIERFSNGNTTVHENHYYITVDGEGVVTFKRQQGENPPAFDLQYDGIQPYSP